MLLQDLRVTPATGSVELGHHHTAVFQEHLEDAVLVRVELDQSAIAAQADRIECIQHGLGGEAGIGCFSGGWHVGHGASYAPPWCSMPRGRSVDHHAADIVAVVMAAADQRRRAIRQAGKFTGAESVQATVRCKE